MKHNFGNLPSVKFNRSKFSFDHNVKTSMSIGKLYPIDCQEVLPGDTFKCDMTAVARCTSAFLKPVVDNIYMDYFHFFVPLRLIFEDSERIFGDPNPSAYLTPNLADAPVTSTNSTVYSGTVGDYLGLPVQDSHLAHSDIPAGISILPFRAFAKIYDDWFRNENAVDEMYIQKGALNASEVLNNNPWSPSNYTGQLPKVGKKKDYFTACLPSQQKGSGVSVPVSFSDGGAVVPTADDIPTNLFNTSNGLRMYSHQGTGSSAGLKLWPPIGGSQTYYIAGTSNVNYTSKKGSVIGTSDNPSNPVGNSTNLYPANLHLAGSGLIDISDLRFAFQLQKYLERNALYGDRYNEFVLAHFGTYTPDSRIQFSEYLGGGRIPISVQQVAQTSEGTATSPLGALGAYSQSIGRSKFSKSFVEHGYVFTVGCIRQVHSYQQGIPRHFMRKSRTDFYDPLFATISEQPVYKSQLFGYVSGSATENVKDNIFAYNEAWAELRYAPNTVTGQMRSGISNSLDIWHLADYYSSAPTYGQSFIEESSANIDRVLAVNTSSQDNFLVDIFFKMPVVRVMPLYSVPGLVDHH